MELRVAVELLAVATALTCSIPGTFLVVRRQAMIADAMSHGLLPGIVLAAVIVHSITSPLLIVGAAVMGLVVVLLTEWIRSTGLVTSDAAVGLFFPGLFSIGVILISTRFAHIHFHEDAVLVGDLNFAAFIQLKIGDVELGPQYLWVMLAVLVLNLVFFAVTYRKMCIATFDPLLAKSLGIRVTALSYSFMFIISITMVAAFNAAGAVLVIALLVVPAATARLMWSRMPSVLGGAMILSVVGAVGGFEIAYALDTATSASMAMFYGLMFVAVWAMRGLVRRLQAGRLTRALV